MYFYILCDVYLEVSYRNIQDLLLLFLQFSIIYFLKCRETHLWYVIPNEVKSEQLLNKYLEFLPKSEKEHVFSMRGDELQKGALLARAFVRTTIARCMTN